MHEFPLIAESQGVHLLFDEVFDGFHVVVGGLLDLFHALGVAQAEVFVNPPQGSVLPFVEPSELGQGQLAQGDKIFDLDLHAIADQGVFGKITTQCFDFPAVTTVYG